MTNSLCHYVETDSPCICCFEELDYERRLSDILRRLGMQPKLGLATRSRLSSRVSRLYDRICFFSDWRYWSPDLDFEYRMLMHVRGVLVS